MLALFQLGQYSHQWLGGCSYAIATNTLPL
jgi:hypothetical protein